MTEDNTKELIAQMNPELRAIFERLQVSIQQSPRFEKEIEGVKKTIIKRSQEPEQALFSFIPHQLAKTSIFFPMSDRELKEESRKIHRLEHETKWGKIVVEGVKLAIYEEDIFLAILSLIKNKPLKRNDTYTTMPEVAKILYGDKSYTKTTYKRIERTLERFELIRFEITLWDWKKKGGEKKRVERKISMAGILSGHAYKPDTQELIIHWNEYFLAFFLESMLTGINLTLRRKLKKDGSKALLRFLSTHRDPSEMNIFTILGAINYNINQPAYELRRKFKSFIQELKQHNVLGKNTKIFNNDTVYFDVIKRKKLLPQL